VALIDRVVLRADTRLSSNVLSGLAARGIGLLVLGGRGGHQVASVLGAPHGDVRRRITQVRRLADAPFQSLWCRRLVAAKLIAQQRLLGEALERRPDQRKALVPASRTLAACRLRLVEVEDLDALRGLEGAGAAAYFQAYASLFAPSLGFASRRRRPPPDPVNAGLSLAYTLLHGLAVQACHVQGLDPMLGYLHRPSHGRASLACDLMEPWRPRVDGLIWRLFAERRLKAGHFGREAGGACLLNKEGRSVLYAAWAGEAQRICRDLLRAARLATGALGDLAPEFDSPMDA